MQDLDEDVIFIQFVIVWVSLVMGGEKLQDVYYIFQEMVDKCLFILLLFNGQVVCYMVQGCWEVVEGLLQEVLDKDSGYLEMLVNFIVLFQYLGKFFEVIN